MSFPVFLGDPAHLVASVPAMLGFTPARSIVLLFAKFETLSDGPLSVHLMVRADSPLDIGSMSEAELAHYAMDMCLRLDAVGVLIVLVDDRLSGALEPGIADQRYQVFLDTLARHLESVHRILGGAWATRALAPKARWWDPLDPTRHGHLPDPATSLLTLAYARHRIGQAIHRSRTELTDLVASDTALRDRVAAELPRAVAAAARRWTRAAQIGHPDADTRQTLWRVMQAITSCTPHQTPAPRVLAEVAVALRDSTIRDLMFGVAAGKYAAQAEQLWSILTRALPDPDRAEAATLLAFHAYLRQDGPLAGIAFEAALTSDPEHRIAHLLNIGLTHGMAPARLRRLCESGIAAATELRIDIGAPQPYTHAKKGDRDKS